MRSNYFFCSCGRRLLKFGPSYEDHIANGEHDARRHAERERLAERNLEDRLRDSAAGAM